MPDDTTMKTCHKCGEIKIRSEFGPRKSNSDGRLGFCRACVGVYNRSYYAMNPAPFKAYRDSRKAEKAVYDAAYYRANREKHLAQSCEWLEKNRAKHTESVRRWQEAHPENKAQVRRNRRALEKGSTEQHTSRDVAEQIASQGGRCFYCGINLNESGMHVDHYIPFVLGGGNGPGNIVCACPSCNLRKNGKHPDVFIMSLSDAINV